LRADSLSLPNQPFGAAPASPDAKVVGADHDFSEPESDARERHRGWKLLVEAALISLEHACCATEGVGCDVAPLLRHFGRSRVRGRGNQKD
jgi:hypothetical protein